MLALKKGSIIQIQYLCPGSIKSINSSNTSAVIVAIGFTTTVRPLTACFFCEKNTYDSSWKTKGLCQEEEAKDILVFAI